MSLNKAIHLIFNTILPTKSPSEIIQLLRGTADEIERRLAAGEVDDVPGGIDKD